MATRRSTSDVESEAQISRAIQTGRFQMRIDPDLLKEALRRARTRKPRKVSLSEWIRQAIEEKMAAEDGKLADPGERRREQALLLEQIEAQQLALEELKRKIRPD